MNVTNLETSGVARALVSRLWPSQGDFLQTPAWEQMDVEAGDYCAQGSTAQHSLIEILHPDQFINGPEPISAVV